MHHFETESSPPRPSWSGGAPSSSSAASQPQQQQQQAQRTPWQTFEHSYPASTSTDTLFADPASTKASPQDVISLSSSEGQDDTVSAGPSVLARGINIAGWTITASKGPIANSAQMDTISSELGIPPPEMLFPANSLVISHAHSGFTYTFDAVRALSSVHGVQSARAQTGLDLREEYERGSTSSVSAAGGKLGIKPKSKGIKVSYAQEWGKGRTELPVGATALSSGGSTTASSDTAAPSTSATGSTATSTSFFGPGVAQAIASAAAAKESSDIASARDYDWTYSNTWTGVDQIPTDGTSQSSAQQSSFQPASDPVLDRIPVEKLGAGSEPILFYDEIVLYEDELADNGDSMLSVKVRVMPSGFLVLQRFMLRVDNVLFRMFDTRMYASFEPPSLSSGLASQSPTPTAASTYGATARPSTVRNGGPIPTLAPSRFPTASTPSAGGQSNASLAHGLNKLSLGPTRRQMREAAAAAAAAPAEETSGSDSKSTAGLATSLPSSSSNTDGTNSQYTASIQTATNPSSASTSSPHAQSSKLKLRVIRECAGWEASYNEVKAKLPPYKAWDLSPLTDPNWIASTLQSLQPVTASTAPQHNVLRTATPSPYSGTAPSAAFTGQAQGARIVGPVDEDKWEGVGNRVDVALLPYPL